MWKIVGTALFALVVSVGAASAQYNYNYPTTPQPAHPPAQGTLYTVNVAMATVQSRREQILTDARGMALYYLATDTPTTTTCTGGCAKVWPPLLSDSTPTHPAALSGKLSVVNDADGPQVSYNGHLLYTYSGDTTPGQAAGDGLYGKWSVAKPGLAVSVSGSPSGTSGGSPGGGW